MCGIFFSIRKGDPEIVLEPTRKLLNGRGPDCVSAYNQSITCAGIQYNISVYCSVLGLRGTFTPQPLVYDKSILCWNGEAFEIENAIVAGSDTRAIHDLLRQTWSSVEGESCDSSARSLPFLKALSSVRGPYAMVYLDLEAEKLWFGRDCLGRRSLLLHQNMSDGISLASVVADGTSSEDWIEVEANGMYVADLTRFTGKNMEGAKLQMTHVPYIHFSLQLPMSQHLVLPYSGLNRATPPTSREPLLLTCEAINKLEALLRRSVNVRVKQIKTEPSSNRNLESEVAILFSGGVDCTLIARLVHNIVDPDKSIDLLNVAFQNPRVHGSTESEDVLNSSAYDACPDRVTGRRSLAELQRVCTGRRWRFVEINVKYSETQANRATVISLMYPHKTEMDLSIANALYFAARGAGIIRDAHDHNKTSPYSTNARVLLSGLGADEIFGGYQRHATAYSRFGFEGLLNELELDINRLGKRNLGRDDRVISHWGREVRYPYLDERFLAWALAAPVWEKMGFGEESLPLTDCHSEKQGLTELPSIEPGKKALRLLAVKLGMKEVSLEKKRAVSLPSLWALRRGALVVGTLY